MNSQFRSVVRITVSCTCVATNEPGGSSSMSIRCSLLPHSGPKRTLLSPSRWPQLIEQGTADVTKRSQSLRLIVHDKFQADRSKPAQCSPKHRSDYRRRQTALAAKCRSSWTDGRNGDRCTGGYRRLQIFRGSYHGRL